MRSLGIALVAAGILAAGARADGLPVLGVDVGTEGVAGRGVRFVALPSPRGTLLARVVVDGGRVESFRYLRGRWTIPAVAYDGSADGLSRDGAALVLIAPRSGFPRASTRLAVVGTSSLKLRDTIELRGDFSFDALSPDGRWLYLIRYLSADDPNAYEVRLYDLELGRLLPEPVVDPAERGEEMRGAPVTRARSSDGRWAYTLYDGAGGHPFVHALDTVGRTARCIDLHALAGRDDLMALRLGLEGTTLAVRKGDRVLTVIDTETFAVGQPRTAATPPDDGGVPWLPLALAAAAAAMVAWGAGRRRRARRPLPTESPASGSPGT